MLPGRIEDLALADVQRLLDNEVREGRAIEYKRELPGTSDSQKKEFLADVSSLANAGGGHLIFGLSTEDGVPTAFSPIELAQPETEVLRIESLAQDGIDPRIIGLATKYFEPTPLFRTPTL